MTLDKGKVMFIDTVHPVLQETLESLGYECVDFTNKEALEISAHLFDYQGVVIRSRFKFTKELMDAAPALRFIARSGSGLENINVAYAKQKKICCFNSPEGNKDALGEHCVAMILSLFNRLSIAHQEVGKGTWLREKNRGVELKGKTVALIGYGVMGQSFAEKLSGFGVNTIAYDNTKTGFTSKLVQEVSMNEVYDKADVVSLHVNYVDDNHHLVNDQFIQSFKKDVYIINTARGKCLDTEALIRALKSGKVSGACLDVLEIESTSFQLKDKSIKLLEALSGFEQVLLTPHIGGWTNESYYKLSSVLGDKIKSLPENKQF